jgi:SAM-dependent methyltransferase
MQRPDAVQVFPDTSTHERVYLDRKPSDEVIRRLCKQYFDAEAAFYDEYDNHVTKRREYAAAIDSLALEALSSSTQRRIVSFGCGTGRREAWIAEHLRDRVEMVGVEPSPRMREIAANRGLRVVSALNAPTLEAIGPATSVLCPWSFLHLPSERARREALLKFNHLLAPLGQLVLDVFNIDDEFGWGPTVRSTYTEAMRRCGFGEGDLFYRRIGSTHTAFLHYFSVAEISTLLEDAGFRMECITGVGYAHHSGKVGVPYSKGSLMIVSVKR